MQINKKYVLSKLGIIRLILIISQISGLISAAIATDFIDGTFYIRDAYLVFSVTGFLISISLYILNITDLIKDRRIRNLPWVLITAISDAILLIPFFITAFFSAIYAAEFELIAWATASFFGFCAALLYISHGVILSRNQSNLQQLTINPVQIESSNDLNNIRMESIES